MISFDNLPAKTGVYIFFKKNQSLYVGKSVNIKARVLTHFKSAKTNDKEKLITDQTTKIQYYLCQSELEALILEARLIKELKPKYNVRWTDDKNFLYIRISLKEEYPKVIATRKPNDNEDKKAYYFGPFASRKVVNQLIREIRKIIPFCTQKKISRRPCFYSKIGYCHPCPNYIAFLKNDVLKKQLKEKYKKNILQVIKILKGKTENILKNYYQQLKKLIKEKKYEEAIVVRNKIYHFENLLSQKKLIEREENFETNNEKSLNDLLELIQPYFPKINHLQRIEAYDISNWGKSDEVGSMVVFTEGISDKSQYRRFKIKNHQWLSDSQRMVEIIKRRFNHQWLLPNLIIIDGGIEQMKAVKKVLKDLSLTIPVIGIVKNPDRIVIDKEGKPLILKLAFNQPGFNLVRAIRDESHRFAKKYHLLLRKKRMI